jgi:hypothetical protein
LVLQEVGLVSSSGPPSNPRPGGPLQNATVVVTDNQEGTCRSSQLRS